MLGFCTPHCNANATRIAVNGQILQEVTARLLIMVAFCCEIVTRSRFVTRFPELIGAAFLNVGAGLFSIAGRLNMCFFKTSKTPNVRDTSSDGGG
jgi:hypothetical protein